MKMFEHSPLFLAASITDREFERIVHQTIRQLAYVMTDSGVLVSNSCAT